MGVSIYEKTLDALLYPRNSGTTGIVRKLAFLRILRIATGFDRINTRVESNPAVFSLFFLNIEIDLFVSFVNFLNKWE